MAPRRPLRIITPSRNGSSLFSKSSAEEYTHFFGTVKTEISMPTSFKSGSSRGIKRGSSNAEDSAFSITSKYNGWIGSIWPMHPRRFPCSVNVTNAPCSLANCESVSLISNLLLFLRYVSMDFLDHEHAADVDYQFAPTAII